MNVYCFGITVKVWLFFDIFIAELVEDTLRNEISEDAENSINPAERMTSTDPVYEELDLKNASDTSPEDHTTGRLAPEGQYITLIHNEPNPCNYETINLRNSPDISTAIWAHFR